MSSRPSDITTNVGDYLSWHSPLHFLHLPTQKVGGGLECPEYLEGWGRGILFLLPGLGAGKAGWGLACPSKCPTPGLWDHIIPPTWEGSVPPSHPAHQCGLPETSPKSHHHHQFNEPPSWEYLPLWNANNSHKHHTWGRGWAKQWMSTRVTPSTHHHMNGMAGS